MSQRLTPNTRPGAARPPWSEQTTTVVRSLTTSINRPRTASIRLVVAVDPLESRRAVWLPEIVVREIRRRETRQDRRRIASRDRQSRRHGFNPLQVVTEVGVHLCRVVVTQREQATLAEAWQSLPELAWTRRGPPFVGEWKPADHHAVHGPRRVGHRQVDRCQPPAGVRQNRLHRAVAIVGARRHAAGHAVVLAGVAVDVIDDSMCRHRLARQQGDPRASRDRQFRTEVPRHGAD